jgi:hypothetical protein
MYTIIYKTPLINRGGIVPGDVANKAGAVSCVMHSDTAPGNADRWRD